MVDYGQEVPCFPIDWEKMWTTGFTAFAEECRYKRGAMKYPFFKIDLPNEFVKLFDLKKRQLPPDLNVSISSIKLESNRGGVYYMTGKESTGLMKSLKNHLDKMKDTVVEDWRTYYDRRKLRTLKSFDYMENMEFSLMQEIYSDTALSLPPGWNLNQLIELKSVLLNDIPGVTKSMSYAGEEYTYAPAHIEDVGFGSVNFVFPDSAPKVWMGVAKEQYGAVKTATKRSQKVPFTEHLEGLEAENMDFIRVNVVLQRPNVAASQLIINVPVKEGSLPLQEVKLHCMGVFNNPNSSIITVTVNDDDDFDDDYHVYLHDVVQLVISDAPPTFASSTQSTATAESTTPPHQQPTETNESTASHQQATETNESTASHQQATETNESTTPHQQATAASQLSVVATTTATAAYTDFAFLPSSNFEEWCAINTTRINDCYNSCIRNKNLDFFKVDLYQYYNAFPQKAVLVLYGCQLSGVDVDGSGSLNNAEELLLKSLVELIHLRFRQYDLYTAGINNLLNTMEQWLGFPVFKEWVTLSSKGRLHNIIKKRRLRQQGSAARSQSGLTAPDETRLNDLAISLRRPATTESVEVQLKRTIYLRRAWIQQLNTDLQLERGAATVFFQKFPIYMTRTELLRYDFEVVMQELYGTVPDMEATLRKYAPTIIYTALVHSVDVLENENDACFKALHALPTLVKTFYTRGQQRSMDYLYVETKNLNISGALARRSTITTAPSIVATNWGGHKSYFVAVDDFALQTASTDITQAMQQLFVVYYVLDLAYDVHMKDLFQLLEYLMGITTTAAAPIANLGGIIQGFFENTPDDFTAVISRTSVTPSIAPPESSDSDPFYGASLSQDLESDDGVNRQTTAVDVVPAGIQDAPTVSEATEHTASNQDAAVDSSTDFRIPPTQSPSHASTSTARSTASISASCNASSNESFEPRRLPPAVRSTGSLNPPAKRSRGRPRKGMQHFPTTSEGSDDMETLNPYRAIRSTAAPPKRGRGRPRKSTANNRP